MTVLCAGVSDVHHVRQSESRAVYLQRVSLHSEIPSVSATGLNLVFVDFFLSSIFLLVRNITNVYIFSPSTLNLENVGECCEAQWVCVDQRIALYENICCYYILLNSFCDDVGSVFAVCVCVCVRARARRRVCVSTSICLIDYSLFLFSLLPIGLFPKGWSLSTRWDTANAEFSVMLRTISK